MEPKNNWQNFRHLYMKWLQQKVSWSAFLGKQINKEKCEDKSINWQSLSNGSAFELASFSYVHQNQWDSS